MPSVCKRVGIVAPIKFSICLFIFIATVFAAGAQTPILEYLFNETGTSAKSTGSNGTPASLLNASGLGSDLHSADATGASLLSGDRAFDNTASTGMGSGGIGGTALVNNQSLPGQLDSFTLQCWFNTSWGIPSGLARLFDDGRITVWGDSTNGITLTVNGVTFSTGHPFYISPNDWVFFAVTYDSTQANNNVVVYENFITLPPFVIGNGTLNAGPVSLAAHPLAIGNYYASNNRPFQGLMDDVRVFGSATDGSGALSQAQLETIWNKDQGFPVITNPLAPAISTTVGTSETLTVGATGRPPLQYSWYHGSALLAMGASPSLTITNAQPSNGGTYSVTVSNALGSVSSTTALTVFPPVDSEGASSQPTYMTVPNQSPGKNCLIVIANGWTNSLQTVDESGTWVYTTGTYIQADVATNWQVEPIDWSEWDPNNPSGTHYPNGSYTGSNPWITQAADTALKRAKQWGVNLGNQWKAQGWKRIHFIAHSAGAGLIESAAMTIGTANCIIQETFLDPYRGSDSSGTGTYGASANWADNYCVRDITFPYTYGPLTHAYTFDVTALDPDTHPFESDTVELAGAIVAVDTLVSNHGFPITYYNSSILAATGTMGFALSQEAGGDGWTEAQALGTNNAFVLVNGDTDDDIPIPLVWNAVENLFNSAYVAAGGISQSVGGFIMQTVAPAAIANIKSQAIPMDASSPSSSGSTWASFVLSGTGAVNLVSFNLGFSGSSSGAGVLSVYWNGSLLGTIDEANVLPGVQTYTFPVTPSGNSQGDILTLRLDDFANTASIASVTNVQTGFSGYVAPSNFGITGSPATQVKLNLTSGTGTQYFIETSTDLSDWEPMAGLNLQSGTSVTITDPDAANYSQRFYRVVTP